MTKWAARSSDLIWRTWDDEESVVYHVPSGATHLLNQVSGQALRHLEDRSLSQKELTARLAASLDCDADEELGEYAKRLLAGFDERGLVERAP